MNTSSVKRVGIKSFINAVPEYACLAVMVVVVIFASILAPKFFSRLNMLNVLKQASVVCIVAIGMGNVLISGCIDLTVGANMAICALIAMTMQKYLGMVGGIALALAVGVCVGFINFLVVYVTKARAMEIMMITFGLKMAYRGLAQAITGNVTYREKTSELFSALGKGTTLGIPNIVLFMAAVAIVLGVMLSRTRFGRQVLCVGNNGEATRLSGISITKVRMKCFLICGLCCGIAGTLLASRTGAVKALSGDGYEMDAMSGLVIGGYSVAGGYGSVWRAVVGVFVYSAVNNVLNLLGVDAYGQQLAQGLMLLMAVWIDIYLRNRRAGGKA